ncbi:MAG: glycosyltransferase [Candidatus Bathycorpusculaceae bacterium]
MKVDLVMWAMNGEKYLPSVLKRIEEVIPAEDVNQKILVDDHSIDNTVNIAREFNWDVYTNPFGGIPSGANEALRHVKTKYFVSIEQDIILAKDWWEKIPPHMENEKVAIAQGIRVADHKVLKKLDEYIYSRMEKDPYRFGVSIDNNIIKTDVVKQLGGFPNMCPTCMDVILMKMLFKSGYRWIIDKKVISRHMRTNIIRYAKHSYELSRRCVGTKYCADSDVPLLKGFGIFLNSPVRGIAMAARKRCFQLALLYPLIRYYKLKGQLTRRNKQWS